ncbi:hypothetical protein NWUPM3A1_80 [Escherichia phage vB_EcoM_3A1_SA_NWU]|jgi:hypothetical protein|uniref:Uncharacterized protein n=15 Tax=Phapecoctavirus TaxID=2733124 RepID=A0A6B9WZD2_9CAUD|nr:hypothetical protein G377_gp171 [Escherichia phage phAPEC8]YP_009786545.1 hypothetical protein HOR21_gp083 [Escherichia phage ESCO13]YP_009787072.1 hypothetical protein HOR27_gp081 [Escherichia phage ESCO5]YP_009803330.1 hypothetical protein HOT48_gp037 [Klebsiella phage ZCKP1]YP_009823748.1 hypothetical protein HOV53_gp082 [Escherichia phage vB_EcoM_Schickermooser]YP_009984961.1 hypothetical protein JR319_gp221 [Escherichia phage vB_EcoM-Ro121c4YLVW]YP_009985532.1 hypothetical protein JR3
MKSKQKRKIFSRALANELKSNIKKTKPKRETSPEHLLFNELDHGVGDDE